MHPTGMHSCSLLYTKTVQKNSARGGVGIDGPEGVDFICQFGF